LLDLIQATSGSVTINEIEVAKSEAWKKEVAAFVDDKFLIDYLTPEEYFEFIAQLRKVDKAALKDFLEQFQDFFNEEILDQKNTSGTFQKETKKRLVLPLLLLATPLLLF
jgi:ABC-2 type transport system ATP-binding protein